VAPTLVSVRNLSGSDVVVNGTIDNPIGTTSIQNTGGPVRSTHARDVAGGDGRVSLIRTNILDLEAPAADVGQSSPRVNVDAVEAASVPRVTRFRTTRVGDLSDTIFLGRHPFYNGQQVRYHADGTVIGGLANDELYYVIASDDGLSLQLSLGPNLVPINLVPGGMPDDEHTLLPVERFRVTTPNDVWLDVKGRLRDASISDFHVIIDAIRAGHDADVLLQAGVQETNVGTSGGVLVNPPGQTYHNYYSTDSGGVPSLDAGVFGSGAVAIVTTYDFRALDVAGDRTIPGITAGLLCPSSCTSGNIIIQAANPAPGATQVNVLGITQIVGTGYPEVITDNHHIDVLTNGFITLTEKTHDLRAGRIKSTANDVLLYSPRMIVDALNDNPGPGDTADVTGVNITMCPGSKLLATPGDAAAPDCQSEMPEIHPLGGVGRPTNWLEINVDVLEGAPLGVVRIFDTFAESTQGVFIGETHHDLKVHTIHTLADVSARTEPGSGSIVDARNGGAGIEGGAPNILGNTIDLDANGGGIGDPTGVNDLEIDSFRGIEPFTCVLTDTGIRLSATCDVGLEADAGIFLTETDQALNLLLAHANEGNIRLTVRESTDLDEHLNLLPSGDVLFAESGPDFHRTIRHGQVFAEDQGMTLGAVLLRVGDNVTLDPHSQILADKSIDIFGDDATAPGTVAEVHHGTNMILRGRIVADCVVSHPFGEPIGTCAPSTANPTLGRITRIWGNTETDHIQFGDLSGITGGTTFGDGITTFASDGFIFLGSQTRAYGSNCAPDVCFSAGDAGHNPSIADGEDTFTVYYLQSADVLSAPAQLGVGTGAGHSLTLDGQADTDYYIVHTTGSHGAIRNYVVNVLDTGEENDGVDELTIYGFDNTATDFNGYVTGTLTKNKTDDIFLLRAVKCIDTQGPLGVTDPAVAVPTTCTSPAEVADHPAFVALLHGDDSASDGGLGGYRSRAVGDEASTLVQRINYDAALNGRMSIYGLGGNDYFAVDDNSAITTLDGGAGYDTFQIGQIFGMKRDEEEGALLPNDTFPVLVATTRGWLSPGTHAPLVATGGTGNDEFVVYSNQAEARLEGDDDNDLFIVRAFALAAVCDTSADADTDCDFDDINLEADPVTGLFPVDSLDANGNPTVEDGICDAAENPNFGGEGWTGFRKDNNGDGVCNKADAQLTGGIDPITRIYDATRWEDDVIPLDSEGVARPIIGLGFSVGRPIDIRAGGGEDEVSYNVNAPVSVDGGTGFDKLVILGTEFADDIAITVKGIFGAGLNVRYAAIEVVEVDGLEGDDEFFVQSTQFGVAYRVIGGLGSDSINVTGDVTEDIVTRELEGVSGTIDHRVTSLLDRDYDGLPVDGLDYNLATPDSGQVIIDDEGEEGTSVREGGSTSVPEIDWYSIHLAADPGVNVYVTASAARSPQEEADDAFSNPEPIVDADGNPVSDSLDDGPADTIWLCAGPAPMGMPLMPPAQCDAANDFRRFKWVNGVFVDENNRALVFAFTGGGAGTWDDKQWVYVYAVDDPPPTATGDFIDARSEGDRVVVIQHSTISANPQFDAVAVRNVEVSVRDNDTPGIYVTEIALDSCLVKCEEDRRTLTIEGALFNPAVDTVPHDDDPPVAHLGDIYTGRTDELLVQLQKDPGTAVVRVKLVMDAESQQAIELDSVDPRWQQWSHNDSNNPLLRFTYYTIDFDATNWDDPVRVLVSARTDWVPEDPQTAVIRFARDDNDVINIVTNPDGTVDVAASELDGGKTFDPTFRYVFPNLRSGTGLTDIEVIDDETADVIAIESGVDTVVQKCGDTFCTVPGMKTDSYTIRLTKQPQAFEDDAHLTSPVNVDVAILADGLADVTAINGVPMTVADYQPIGGLVPAQLFKGNIEVSADGLTITRANGSDLGSFIDEGFEAGNLIRFQIGMSTYDREIDKVAGSVTEKTLTLKTALPLAVAGATHNGVSISYLTREGIWEGPVQILQPAGQGWQVIRQDASSWLGDGFLEGQWVEVCVSNGAGMCTGASGRFKIQIIRGDNATKDEKLEFRYRDDESPSVYFFQDDLGAAGLGGTHAFVQVTRLAAVAKFDDDLAAVDDRPNWYEEQEIVLTADVNYFVPISRQGIKVFPVSTHGLWKLRGPLATEGGVTGADRSLQLGLKLPGEKDGPLFKIGTQPPETKQIDVLNIFNDGSKEDREGTTTSTTLSGLGLPKDLDFGPTYSSGNPQTFGEPAIFPGGIGYGTVQFIDGKFVTNGAKSTIEVVNLMNGIGNDSLDIQGTLDPDDAVKLTGTIVIEPSANDPHADGVAAHSGIDLTRPIPFDWKAQGFLVGQPVHISGFAQTWTVVGFSDDDLTDTQDFTRMHLNGPNLTQAEIDSAPYQVSLSVQVDDVTVAGGASGGMVTRASGNWIAAGFIVGQRIQLDGLSGVWRLHAITNGNKTLVLADGPALASAASATRTVTSVVRTVIADDVAVKSNVPITISGGPFGGTVTRTVGTWTADKFQPGQLVMIQGLTGSWRLREISVDGKTLTLERGAVLPTIAVAEQRLVFWPGPHGGLTVVHGGGNRQLKVNFEMDSTANSVSRLDGRSWIDAGFAVGQKLRIGNAGSTTRTISGFVNSACPFNNPFPGCGLDSTIELSGDAIPVVNSQPVSIHVAEPERVETTALMNITVQPAVGMLPPTSTLTCVDPTPCFSVSNPGHTVFHAGQKVWVSGLAGPWTIASVTSTEMVLAGAALTPTYKIVNDVTTFTPVELTVFGFDENFDGGARMGGDTIVVCNPTPLDATKPCRGPLGTDRLAGPESPLVIYGDTSQDGVWYGGRPYDIKGYEFGPKPFDPFWKIPDGQNEDDEWVFPLANPFDFAGNDIIDASNLFADVSCVPGQGNCSLPTVGFTADAGAGNDLILGSQTGDHLAGGSGDDIMLGLRGVDHIYGDSGVNVDILTRGLTVSTTNASPRPTLDTRNPAGDQTLKPVPSENADLMEAGRDRIYGEGTWSYTVGETVRPITTVLGGPQEAYDDVIGGDHIQVIQQTADPNEPDARLQKIQTTTLASIRRIESRAYQNGNDDEIFGNDGRDVIISGAGHDLSDGDERDDMLFGDNAFLLRRVVEPTFPAATDYSGVLNTDSGRFQALCGSLMYSRTDRANDCGFGNPVGEDTSGQLLVNGDWLPYRDPDSSGLDSHPWWSEYLVDFDDENLSHQFHSFDVQLSVENPSDPQAKGLGSFGNDYLAGSESHDLLFGQMGNDVIQGDGGIETALAGTSHVGASRSPDGCIGAPGVNLVCDYVGDLDMVPSFEASTDGEDYIEGGGGDDVVFGGLGQDDILGGSSDFYGLEDELLSLVGQTVTISGLPSTWRITGVSGAGNSVLTLFGAALPSGTQNRTVEILGTNVILTNVSVTLTSALEGGTLTVNGFDWAASGFVPGMDRRPDGSDLIFGGAGTREDRNIDTIPTTIAQSHARDADTVIGDNGRIVRIVGVNNTDLAPQDGDDQRYVRFNYDNYSNAVGYDADGKIVVRGVHLLDYTPGGPDFRPDLFFPPNTTGPCSGSPATGECSMPLPGTFGINKYIDIGGHDDVHGESGDDTVYTGPGHDKMFGDGQDDDLVGGWGNDWISGGTGQDGVLGDDGRIFTSRVTGCAGANCWSDLADLSEPLYGVDKFLIGDPDVKKIQGYVLNEFIYTPGQVQTATINIGGELKKEFDLTPYNLGPNVVQGHFQVNLPLYDANNSDDVIFGGWNDPLDAQGQDHSHDFLHGGAGDDAIGGHEALSDSYVQHFSGGGAPDGVVRTDWTRPFNRGNLLLFGADTDPWNDPKPVQQNLGEFYLYDEYDPRRTILFNPNGTKWDCNAFSNNGKVCIDSPPPPLSGQYFLNLPFNVADARHTEGYLSPLSCVQTAPNGTCLATDTILSDGNDLIFGDLGNDWMVGGTGKDDIYAGWGNDLSNADDVFSTNGNLNDQPETHGWFEDRVYGGAGIDILIGNTGGDRLIDWVGEWNTYLVPFSPFGIATVSRQNNPALPEFLYALSASDGADATRDTDTGADVTRPGRNGEYEGEMGLIVQQDHGYWQEQTGGPTDPQAGNIPGGARDVLRGADFNNGQFQAFAVDSGVWEVTQNALKVSAASLDQDAAAVFYSDAYLPVYYEITASIAAEKPIGGWKSNAYVIFDYFTPTDFKFAGIDVSINKLVVGQRTTSQWQVVQQSSVPGSVKADTIYQLLVAVNGTTVSVAIDGRQLLTHTFGPRMIDGISYGLNKGLVGAGADNSRGTWDNYMVQTLPPQLTLDLIEDFNDGQAQLFTGDQVGTWTVNGGRYASTATAGQTTLDVVDLGVGGLRTNSYLELRSTFRITTANGIGGILFDEASADRYKFVALDLSSGGSVIVGHADRNKNWVVDTRVAKALAANTDYAVNLILKGTSVSVEVNGAFVVSYAFNAPVVDGALGVLARGGTASFDRYQIRTNDPAFAAPAAVPRQDNGQVLSSDVTDVRWDVDRDGYVSPIDALLIINALNRSAASASETFDTSLDVNGDRMLSSIDALLIINELNRQAKRMNARSISLDRPVLIGEMEAALPGMTATANDETFYDLDGLIDDVLSEEVKTLDKIDALVAAPGLDSILLSCARDVIQSKRCRFR
jgi:Ca2+-binding RTX toxin-like protein